MATTADFKNGMYLNFNGKPCMLVYFQHVKPGKGPAFVKPNSATSRTDVSSKTLSPQVQK